MGFVDKGVRRRGTLPTDLPDPFACQGEGRPVGTRFKTADGSVFSLVHASWRRVSPTDKPAVKSSKS